jgi:hypothetical protein
MFMFYIARKILFSYALNKHHHSQIPAHFFARDVYRVAFREIIYLPVPYFF